jgi:hypothetical protein
VSFNARELEERFPLVVPGVEVVRDCDPDPEPTFPLSDSDRGRWERMPRSKRRLAVFGALEAGQEAARMSVIILAAESRAVGIAFDVAMHLCLNITFTTASTSRHRVAKQLPRAAQFGYEPPNKVPLLTGCCRDPRPKSGGQLTTKLRRYMAPYCDGACAASCPMLRGIRFPERTIAETEYAHIDESDLWQPGSGYGQAGRLAYRQLALLASLTPDRIVPATSNYLALRLNGDYTHDHLKRILRRFDQEGLVPVIDREGHTIRRHVPVLGVDELRALERRLGVRGKRASNVRAARRATGHYQDHLYEMLSDEDKIEAWTALSFTPT